MSTVIGIILTLIIFVLFAMNKEYFQILLFLIFYLVADWAVVKIFSTTPLIGGIAISVGEPIINILIYAIVGLISMGILYYLVSKYNFFITLIGYLIINFIINKFYFTISGNIFIDLIFNAIIGSVIIFAYKKSSIMDELKWFAIIGVIIEAIIRFSISAVL